MNAIERPRTPDGPGPQSDDGRPRPSGPRAKGDPVAPSPANETGDAPPASRPDTGPGASDDRSPEKARTAPAPDRGAAPPTQHLGAAKARHAPLREADAPPPLRSRAAAAGEATPGQDPEPSALAASPLARAVATAAALLPLPVEREAPRSLALPWAGLPGGRPCLTCARHRRCLCNQVAPAL